MSNDEHFRGRRDEYGRRTSERARGADPRPPVPGKVTPASRLSQEREPAVQRKPAGTGGPAPRARSLWEHTMDPWMDAAFRGSAAFADRGDADRGDADRGDAVQTSGDVAGAEPAAVHRAAAEGVSGDGSALPYFDRIQAAFGGHDLGPVRAHVGGAAAAASEQMGAEAFAAGSHVAFRAQPDLHTAAHEAAHVVQQRAGVQLSDGVGRAGDAYEQHANHVADAVVRGEPAAPILDAMSGTPAAGHTGGHGAGAAAVQRKSSGKKQREDRDYDASWDDITSAAQQDQDAIDRLDVAWIDSLDPHVVQEIDREFHEGKVEAAFAKQHAGSKDVKAIGARYKKDEQRLRNEARARLVTAGVKKPSAKAIDEDPEYIAASDARKGERDQELEVARTEQRAAFDEEQVKPSAPMMVLTPPGGKVTRVQGRVLARADFTSWGMLVFGSADRLKEHYRAIKLVPGTDAMYLHEAAGARFVAARAWFEKTYPGYTFRKTTIAMSLRNRHQEGHGQGKLGHPLGISADFDAFDNPNQLGDGPSQYMLRRFGGVDENKLGMNQIRTGVDPNRMTKEIGQATVRGEELTARQLAFLDSVERGYNEMAATSRRFQASRAEQMPELRQAESLWFEQGVPALNRLRDAEKNVESERKKAVKRLGKELKGLDDSAREDMINSDPGVQAAIAARDAAQASFDPIQEQVTTVMQAVFEPWTGALQDRINVLLAKHDPAHLELDVTIEQVDRLLHELKTTKKRKDIDELIADNQKAFSAFDASALPEDPPTARNEVARYLDALHQAKWAAGEVRVMRELIHRLEESPTAVFGTQAEKDKQTGRLRHRSTVAAPTVMQYLERGFARDDAMPEQPGAEVGGKHATRVFNAAFIRCMAMFGFNTLATWSGVDTMHFDFREGFDGIQKHDLYSP
jgi:hypothetical protein